MEMRTAFGLSLALSLVPTALATAVGRRGDSQRRMPIRALAPQTRTYGYPAPASGVNPRLPRGATRHGARGANGRSLGMRRREAR